MADIASVSSQIQQLESSYDWWNSITIWLTAATALVAALYFGASRMASREGKRLDEARKMESRLKEEQQQKEKDESDREIAKANENAGNANEMAARSNAIAAEANEHAKKIELHAEELRNENLKLGIKLEEERQARLEIERRLAPRFLSLRERNAIRNALSPYAGHSIEITRLGDAEAGAYGDQIIKVFEEAKWQVHIISVGLSLPTYGVIVSISKQPDTAVKTLISAFQTAGIEFTVQTIDSFRSDSVKLFIALKNPR